MASEAVLQVPKQGMIARSARFVASLRHAALWALGAAAVGALVGLTLALLTSSVTDNGLDWWFVWQSVLSAEAILVSAIVVVRHTLPQYEGLRPSLRYALILITLLGATLVATAFSLLTRPTVVFSQGLTFLALAILNSMLALMLGGALITWDTLKARLDRAYEQLREKEAFEREMAVAREVQRNLLPEHAPRIDGYRFAYVCRSAAAVGGDTVDFLDLPEGRLGLVIGDVVGKGIAAALQMANLQALVRALAPRESHPHELNTILSQAIGARCKPGRFITLAYVILDPETGGLRYSMAGHHPPIIVGPAGVRELARGGLPLGILASVPYESGEDELEPGETMLLFTDGVIEAPPEDASEEEFGKERVTALVRRALDRSPEEILDSILGALDGFRGRLPAFDDTTLIVVQRLPADSGEGRGQ